MIAETSSTSRSRRLLAFLVAIALSAPGLVYAQTVTVPDDYATIQAAIDAAPDTVLIRPGTYHERPVIDLPVVLLGMAGGPRPRIDGLHLDTRTRPEIRSWRVERCDFSERVDVSAFRHDSKFTFIECAFDSGLFGRYGDSDDISYLGLVDCRLGGPIRTRASTLYMERDTLDAGISATVDDDALIYDCWFRGGAGTAIQLDQIGPTISRIRGNLIENYDRGIHLIDEEALVVESNLIRNIRGTALDLHGWEVNVLDNRIEDCEVGIRADVDDSYLRRNTVLRATDAGVILDEYPITFEHNVVGECSGPGVRTYRREVVIRNNTIFDNGGSGIEFVRGSGVVQNNICYGNGGWGVSVGPDGAVLGCNDWFGNSLGATNGIGADPTDLSVDPAFCDLDNTNVSLAAGSPLLDAAGCGQIGARGQGCATTPVLIALLRAEADPDCIRIEWQWGGLERPASFWIDRAEDASGPWARIVADRHEVDGITVDLDRQIEAGHSYFYRLAWITENGERSWSELITVTALGAVKFAQVFIAPNPSSGPVEIAWSLPRAGDVDITVFDIVGREIARLAEGVFAAGTHQATWNGRTLGGSTVPGLYFVRLRHDGREVTRRVLLRR